MIVFVDEVGCSPIAGPVLACAVAVSDSTKPIPGVIDSKKVSKKKREDLFCELEKLDHAFGSASPAKIRRMNIHYAKLDSMRIAVERLLRAGIKIDKVIVDGSFKIPGLSLPQEAIIKADAKFWQCGAASILAKVKRDYTMTKLAKIEKYSYYDWENNAGYFVEQTHKWGIVKFGGTSLHRNNFGYYQYCLFCRRKYEEFLEQGKRLENYKQFEVEEETKYGKSFYAIWKSGVYDSWKEIKYGEND